MKNNVENSDSEKKEGLFGVLFTHTMAKFMPAVIPTSISIFSHPIAYGSAVKDDAPTLRRALTYSFECFALFIFLLFACQPIRPDPENFSFADVRFGTEIMASVAAILILIFLVVHALCVHLLIRLFGWTQKTSFGTVSVYLYWYSISLLLLGILLGLAYSFAGQSGETSVLPVVLLLGSTLFPLLIACSWFRQVNNLTRKQVAIAFIAGAFLNNFLGVILGFVGKIVMLNVNRLLIGI